MEKLLRQPGFTRVLDPDLDTIVSTRCDYCGETLVGSLSIVQQFEPQHRASCLKPSSPNSKNENR